jgi:hypothetical protein
MRLQFLDLAREDLVAGFHYYEDKEDGLGRYFLINLYSDIESRKVFGAFTGLCIVACAAPSPSGLPSGAATRRRRGGGPHWRLV